MSVSLPVVASPTEVELNLQSFQSKSPEERRQLLNAYAKNRSTVQNIGHIHHGHFFTDELVKELKPMSDLETLNLATTAVTHKALEIVARHHPKMKYLLLPIHLFEDESKEEAMRALALFHNVAKVGFTHSKKTVALKPETVIFLRERLPQSICHLQFPWLRISDFALLAMQFKHIISLDLRSSIVTSQAFSMLHAVHSQGFLSKLEQLSFYRTKAVWNNRELTELNLEPLAEPLQTSTKASQAHRLFCLHHPDIKVLL